MRIATTLVIAACLGGMGLARTTWAGPIDYDITQAGASSPSDIRPGDITTALNTLVLTYNNGMTWNITLGNDPTNVLNTRPVPQKITLGELMTHNGSSYVIYDRLAVRAVVQWIGYDNGHLSSFPALLGHWTDQLQGRPLIDTGDSSASGFEGGSGSGGGSGGGPAFSHFVPVPEPSTLAISVIAGSVVLGLFRRRRNVKTVNTTGA